MRSRASFLLIGVIVGALGAAALFFLGLVPGIAVVFGGIFGGCFALLTRFRATTPGAGLLWGLSFSFLLWPPDPLESCRNLCRTLRWECWTWPARTLPNWSVTF